MILKTEGLMLVDSIYTRTTVATLREVQPLTVAWL